jgi:hypothetical protein
METQEAIDILENIIDDEVIGIYCMEIQKRGVNCDENCKDKDCYLSEAISTIIKHIEQLQADKNKLINYIAVRENKTHEEVCKEFEV